MSFKKMKMNTRRPKHRGFGVEASLILRRLSKESSGEWEVLGGTRPSQTSGKFSQFICFFQRFEVNGAQYASGYEPEERLGCGPVRNGHRNVGSVAWNGTSRW
jgi:hypothetical protein